MIRNDYIMRLIQMLGVFAARIAKLIAKGEDEQADTELSKACSETLGLPLAMLEGSTSAHLVSLFTSRGQVDYFKVFSSGVLLGLKADLEEKQGNEVATYQTKVNSLSLLLHASESLDEEIVGRSREKIDSALGWLTSYEIPAWLRVELADFFEREGRYGRAEDQWYEAVEMDDENFSQKLSFYNRLQGRTDAELEAGNLPRVEVEQAILECKDKAPVR